MRPGQVSEAAHEARDNVKFLATLDQSIAPLHTATLPELLDTLPALFASLHTLQNASRCGDSHPTSIKCNKC